MRIRQKNTYGLSLQKNSLIVADGSSEQLINVLHQRDGLYIKERGFDAIYDPSETIYGCFEFDDYIYVILNSQIIRIDKFGTPQGSKTSSDTPFEIDGTLRPGPYSFFNAPFSVVFNDQAFFCTPEGTRVIRQSSTNSSEEPGLDAPVIKNTADPTVTNNNLKVAEGTMTIVSSAVGTAKFLSKSFYANDFTLTAPTVGTATDCPSDQAISYRAVLRRDLANGQIIESEPSQPVFAFNKMINVWWSDDPTLYGLPAPGATQIRVAVLFNYGPGTPTASPFVVNEEYTIKLANATALILNSTTSTYVDEVAAPYVDGTYIAKVVLVDPLYVFFEVDIGTPPSTDYHLNQTAGYSLGSVDFAIDRYSSLEIEPPPNAKVGDFIDIYFSKTEVPLSSNPLAVPNGDYYLAKEVELTGGGTISVNFSDGIFQKGPPLYSNPSDGDLTRQPNVRPPGANCIESWKGHLFYGNTYKRHRVDLTHIGGALTANRTFSIQFTDSGTPENFTFSFIQTDADAVTIKKRVMTLAALISSTSTNFLAYYSNDITEFPGGLTIISLVPNRAFKVFVNNADLGNAMEPKLGVSFAATDVVSTQEAKRNRVYWSKQGQPEAVPYSVDIGDENEDILNIERTRESLIVVKRDGIFSLYGDPFNGVLGVREIDTTVKGISSTGVTRLGNRVYAKTNQGIVSVSESGMTLVSRNQVEPLLKVSDEDSVGDTTMFGFEDDRQLYIATSTSPVDSTKTVYSYNTVTQSWSTLSKVFTWGFVISNNFTVTKTFQNNRVITDGSKIFLERKDYLLTDFADEKFSFTVSSISADKLTVTLSGPFTGSAGSVLTWDNGSAIKIYRITEVSGSDVTLNIPFSGSATDAVVLYTPIQSTILTSPIDGGDSSIVKQFTKFVLNTRYDALSVATLEFKNDWFKNGDSVEWTKRDERRGWGQEQWGRFPWGQATAQSLQYLTQPSQIIQTEIPRTMQKSTFVQAKVVHSVACEGMFIQQIAFEIDSRSGRPAR